MTFFQAIVLAIVQGLTEFLPVSSTAHLILVPWLFGWRDPGLAFDVALHTSTLAAVLAYFARDWITLFRGAFRGFLSVGDQTLGPLLLEFNRIIAIDPEDDNVGIPDPPPDYAELRARLGFLFWIVVATLPAAFAGYLFEDYAESVFRSPSLIAAMLMGVAVLMWAADRRTTLVRGLDSVAGKDALLVGLAQVVAIVPGTSRAGVTMAAGMFRNLTRESAARFSFLLATPIIGGATLFEGAELWHEGLPPGVTSAHFAVGAAVSGVVGYAAIAFLLRYLQTRTLKIFVAYRMGLSGIIMLVEFLRSAG